MTNETAPGIRGKAAVRGHWTLNAYDPDGHLIRSDAWDNLVVDEGLDELLAAGLAGATQTTAWYIGLTDGTPTPAAADTLASHAGWVEVTAYTEAARQAWSAGSVASQSVDNSAAVATFSINANSTTIGGAFLASVSSGTTGKLYAIGPFTGGDLVLSNGSTLDVTATFTTAAV